jgi:hypothetical protein
LGFLRSDPRDQEIPFQKEVKAMILLDLSPSRQNEEYRLSLLEAERSPRADNSAELIQLTEQLAVRSGTLAIPIVTEGSATKDR